MEESGWVETLSVLVEMLTMLTTRMAKQANCNNYETRCVALAQFHLNPVRQLSEILSSSLARISIISKYLVKVLLITDIIIIAKVL